MRVDVPTLGGSPRQQCGYTCCHSNSRMAICLVIGREDIFVVVDHGPQDRHCLVLLVEVLQCASKTTRVNRRPGNKNVCM